MLYYLSKITLSLVAVFSSAGILSAAECTNNINRCTPKQLCEAATSTDNGTKVWTTNPSFSGHVKTAQNIGIDCGVVEIVASCETDAELCTFTEVCEKAVQISGAKTKWNTDGAAASYVAVAKKHGMSCGVTIASKDKADCISDAKFCAKAELCRQATIIIEGRPTVWEDKLNFQRYVMEAQNRGLTCDVTPDCKRGATSNCLDNEICYKIHLKFGKDREYNEEASRRGLRCFNGEVFSFPTDNDIFCRGAISRGSASGIIPSWSSEDYEKEASKRGVSCGTFSGDKLTKIFIDDFIKGLRQKHVRNRKSVFNLLLAENAIVDDVSGSPSQIITQTLGRASKWPKGQYDVVSNETYFQCRGAPFVADKRCSLNLSLRWSGFDFPEKKFAELERKYVKIKFLLKPEWKLPTQIQNAINGNQGAHSFNLQILELKSLWSEKNSAKANTITTSRSIIMSVQKELNRIGCNVGSPDGLIGPKTRKGLFAFTSRTEFSYNPKLMQDQSFLNAIKNYPKKTCPSKKPKQTRQINQTSPSPSPSNNSAELRQLQGEREMLAANLQAMQQMMDQQERMANAAYNSCFSRCALNNRAGSGIMGALGGMAQCNMSCAPLKYGGAAIPPSWERDKRRYQTVDCMITRISKNQATASCR